MTIAYMDYHGAPDTESGEKTCTTFEWDGEDLVMNNRNVRRYKYVLRSGNTMFVPHLTIHHLLAEKMGWFEKKRRRKLCVGTQLEHGIP